MIRNIINQLVLIYMQKNLDTLRKSQDTPYIYIKGTEKDYPKYLMYTDKEEIRAKMHNIK